MNFVCHFILLQVIHHPHIFCYPLFSLSLFYSLSTYLYVCACVQILLFLLFLYIYRINGEARETRANIGAVTGFLPFSPSKQNQSTVKLNSSVTERVSFISSYLERETNTVNINYKKLFTIRRYLSSYIV